MHLAALPNWQPSHFAFETAPRHLHKAQNRSLSGENMQRTNKVITKDVVKHYSKESIRSTTKKDLEHTKQPQL